MVGLGGDAWARYDSIPGPVYQSGRAAAMGNAFLPLGDDPASALFYNPAALGHVQKFHAEPLNIALVPSTGYLSSLNQNFFQIFSLAGFAQQLAANPNTWQGMNLALFPNVGWKFFAVGLLGQMDFLARNDGAGNLRYRTRYDLIPAASAGVKLANGVVRLGYTLQWVHTSMGDQTVSAAAATSYTQGLYGGAGFSHNAGFALTFPIKMLPQFNVVARNILGLQYSAATLMPFRDAGPPPTQPMSIDISGSLHPRFGKGHLLNLVFQWNDITGSSGYRILSRLALGAEVSFRDFLYFRVGMANIFPTAGFGLKTRTSEFNFAYTHDQIGTAEAPERNDKIMFQFKAAIF